MQLDVRRLVAVLDDRDAELRVDNPEGLREYLTFQIGLEGAGFTVAELQAAHRALQRVRPAAGCAFGDGSLRGEINHLNLTALLLGKRPPDERAELLSVAFAKDLFFRSLPLTFEEARALAPEWHVLDVAQIRQLRKAKNLIGPIELMREQLDGDHLDDERIDAWIRLRPRLP
jgi:hypothetical protein